ncbi:hypothetical protein IB276_33105 [Ensifer sp. ENS04]|uniref:hypothetical protein n=1 Tax=Ensifer sp. ENS04 TaxID=2769281 RepID=UPI00177CFCE0|nr:hypothetical protein [Ensifer sp. ENS04]MBD9544286.1 hypothetical protein [Ensifer sp. ENS04]
MVVATAAQPAGSIVLPEGIVRVSDIVTTTAETKGLDGFPEGLGSYYFSTMLLTAQGRVIGDRAYFSSLAELERFNSEFCQKVHVFRTGGKLDCYDFFYDEVLPSIEENPWLQYSWFKDNFIRWAELLPRPSVTPGLLAYYQTPEKRARNIRTPIKPGRFLQKYFADVLSEVEIHRLALEWSNACEIRAVKITQDAGEIEKIYQGRHLGSCMWFENDEYEGNKHPARVYAGPDLGIAYIGPIDEVDARVLVWPEKKVWYDRKVYGDESRIRNALQDLGWRPGGDSDFRGARIQRYRYDNCFILPYIDCADTVEDDGRYLIIGRGSIAAHETEGLSGPIETCSDCGEAVGENDSNYIHDGRQVCDECINEKYFYCQETSEYWPDEDQAPTNGEHRVSMRGVRNGSWTLCDHTNLYYPDDEMVELHEGGDCAEHHVTANGFFCVNLEKWSLENDKRLELSDGEFVHMDAFESREDLEAWLEIRDLRIVFNDPNQLSLPLHLTEAA